MVKGNNGLTHLIEFSHYLMCNTEQQLTFLVKLKKLEMDISYPTDDTIPVCGGPLIVLIHGGTWLLGSKEDVSVVRMREDFAKRGYASASVNYRLGQFNTHLRVNCNVSSLFDVNWNCLNMADESEWYRAQHRAVQDVNGAIRFLVNNATSYNIDPSNIFIVGESAGGFVALSAGFTDNNSELIDSLTGAYPNVPKPNSIYESTCIQANGFALDIDSMDLSRPELGSYEGLLNPPVNNSYSIKGVGSFFGGVFNNVFHSISSTIPALYLYHQPCDLIVPYNYSRVFTG
ncbi:alpha/beta hydrolase [Bacteroidia bacterium]|nr:alpha/beta hydrolase [Bacteroidia bacterium]MDB9883440.1 alpha/beta hydrolase [Bacteroidia bacterium]